MERHVHVTFMVTVVEAAHHHCRAASRTAENVLQEEALFLVTVKMSRLDYP